MLNYVRGIFIEVVLPIHIAALTKCTFDFYIPLSLMSDWYIIECHVSTDQKENNTSRLIEYEEYKKNDPCMPANVVGMAWYFDLKERI